MDLQLIQIAGRSVKDAELLDSKAGKKYTKFTLAINVAGKEKTEEQTVYYECLVFGEKSAEAAAGKIKKGTTVLVHGTPSIEAYLSKENQPKAQIVVMVSEWYASKSA